jgi:hypothetical protein
LVNEVAANFESWDAYKKKIEFHVGAAAKLDMPLSTLESRIRSLKINKFQFKGV